MDKLLWKSLKNIVNDTNSNKVKIKKSAIWRFSIGYEELVALISLALISSLRNKQISQPYQHHLKKQPCLSL